MTSLRLSIPALLDEENLDLVVARQDDVPHGSAH